MICLGATRRGDATEDRRIARVEQDIRNAKKGYLDFFSLVFFFVVLGERKRSERRKKNEHSSRGRKKTTFRHFFFSFFPFKASNYAKSSLGGAANGRARCASCSSRRIATGSTRAHQRSGTLGRRQDEGSAGPILDGDGGQFASATAATAAAASMPPTSSPRSARGSCARVFSDRCEQQQHR